MPEVTIAHMHDSKSIQAGLVLRLTRSIPYVLTYREMAQRPRNALARSLIERAAGVICPNEEVANGIVNAGYAVPVDVIPDISHSASDGDMADNRIAAEHQRVYRRAVDTRRIPALLL